MSEPVKSDPLRALLDLDPALLAANDRSLIHPAVRYCREPWDGSSVRPFSAAVNGPALAEYALDIVQGRRRGGIETAVMRRARDLHAAMVPRDIARRELRRYEAALRAYLELAQGRANAG